MPLLEHDSILQLRAAVIDARLSMHRAILLVGIDSAFVAGLPSVSDASAQLLSDLDALNSTEELPDGTVPLVVWLKNVHALCLHPKPKVIVVEALERLTGANLGSNVLQRGVRISNAAEIKPLISAVPPELARLVVNALPRLLARHAGHPLPILIRANVALEVAETTALDQWTSICHRLTKAGVPGHIDLIQILDEVQQTAFSDIISAWASEYLRVLLEYLRGDDPGGATQPTDPGPHGSDPLGVLVQLAQFAAAESRRWRELEHRIQALRLQERFSTDMLDSVVVLRRFWAMVDLAMWNPSAIVHNQVAEVPGRAVLELFGEEPERLHNPMNRNADVHSS